MWGYIFTAIFCYFIGRLHVAFEYKADIDEMKRLVLDYEKAMESDKEWYTRKRIELEEGIEKVKALMKASL